MCFVDSFISSMEQEEPGPHQFADDQGRWLLRQMALQTENKLARCAHPALKPKDVVHINFSRLAKGRDKGVDTAAFQRVATQHPGLEDGLESLKELGTPRWGTRVGHPASPVGVQQQAVTSKLLRELIDQEYADGDPVKPDVVAVLACLEHLATHLGESIFVSTT